MFASRGRLAAIQGARLVVVARILGARCADSGLALVRYGACVVIAAQRSGERDILAAAGGDAGIGGALITIIALEGDPRYAASTRALVVQRAGILIITRVGVVSVRASNFGNTGVGGTNV